MQPNGRSWPISDVVRRFAAKQDEVNRLPAATAAGPDEKPRWRGVRLNAGLGVARKRKS